MGNTMRRSGIILCIGIALAAIIGGSIHFLSRDSERYCRVRFGTGNANEVILAATPDLLLLFRSGDTESAPERYPLDHGSLPEDVTIPPIDAGNGASYTITSVS